MVRAIETELSLQRARQLLSYDPETGILRWDLAGRRRRKKGTIAGSKTHNGYLTVCADGYRVFAHRLIWFLVYGHWPRADIDHINGNRSDNRLVNLREAERWQNHGNKRVQSNNKCGIKGVIYEAERKKWRASITLPGGRHSRLIGRFKTKEEAAEAYAKAAAARFGEFARPSSVESENNA